MVSIRKLINPSESIPGSKDFGYLEIETSIAGSVEMPVGVVNGSSPGPTLAVTAGLFAHEYCGIEAAARIYQMILPEELFGRLLVVPVVSLPCLRFRTPWLNLAKSVSPIDGQNINKLFPGELRPSEEESVVFRQSSTTGGDPSGSLTKVIAYRLFHDIILEADYHVDLRGGDLDESHMAHTIFTRLGSAVDVVCEEMARVFGMKYLLPGTPEVGHTSKGTLIFEAAIRGIPSIISESGIGYQIQPTEPEIMQHVTGVKNLLHHFDMLPGKPAEPPGQMFLDSTWHWIPAPVAGIFHALVDQGELVAQDQTLGTIRDFDGSLLRNIVSPIDGIVHCMFPRRFVSPGDDVYTLLKVAGAVEKPYATN